MTGQSSWPAKKKRRGASVSAAEVEAAVARLWECGLVKYGGRWDAEVARYWAREVLAAAALARGA